MPKRSFSSPQRQPTPRRSRSRKPIFFLLGIALIALVWFAPAIIANSPLKHRLLASAAGDFQGTIVVGPISAGWLSQISAKNIVAFDTRGERLVEAASIQLDKNLIALLQDHSDLGTIRVVQPVVKLVLRPDGSNIEDAIAPWLVPSDEPSNIGCKVEIENAVVEVADTATGSQWTATKLNAAIGVPANSNSPLTLHIDSVVNPANAASGKLLADMLWQRKESSAGSGNLTVKASSLPIELASPGLQRLLPGTTASGLIDGEVFFDWGDATSSARIGQLTARNFNLLSPQWLGTDRFAMELLQASGEVTQRGSAWQAQELKIHSDIGEAIVNGTASVTVSDEKTMLATTMEALRYGRFQVAGHLDLARLAQMMPTTLKIREGAHVATGEVRLAISSDTDTNGQRWDGRVEAKNLSAMYEGRHVTWDQPVVLTATARELNGLVTFDKLACESSFLEIVASGTSAQGTATMRGDFARLAAELSQFVDLGDLRFAGLLGGQVEWQAVGDQTMRLSASATAEQFELVSARRPAWREDKLTVQLTGIGRPSEKTVRAIDECKLRVVSGRDQLDLTLLPTPAGTVRETALPVELRLTGELRNWVARLQPIMVVSGWNIDGSIELDAAAKIAANQVQIDRALVQLGNFRATNGSVFINEPVLKIETKGTLDRSNTAYNSPDTTVASSSLALRATNVDVRMGAAGTQLAGDVDYRGDVNKLASLFNDPQQLVVRQVSGQATGHAKLRHDGQVTSCEWSSDITDFAYAVPATLNRGQVTTDSQTSASGWDTVWQEPKLKVTATALYDGTNNVVDLSRVEAAGDTISFAARGKLSELATRCTTELDGQVAYDLEKLSTRFRKQLGNNFQIAGRDTRPFSFRGPLLSSTKMPLDGLHPVSTGGATAATSVESAILEMIAQASLGWTSASVQGITIGAGEVDAKLADGRLVFTPLDLAVSEGNIHLAPTVLLDRSPMVMTLPAGVVADRIRISPQMCTSWLKYLAPLVADATAAQGNFSVSLDQAVIPLNMPAAGQIEGVLEIHTAQVGPGPLSQQLLLLAAQIKAIADGNLLGAPTAPAERWLDLPQQRIAFRMAENRVYHQGLQMVVKDVVIRTSGSVGTDQSISLMAEVPVRDEWLSRSQYLAALRGQTIQIPIRGTLTNPKLDQSALTQITQQTVTGAASRYLQGGAEKLNGEIDKQLNRGLEKLFAPR